MPQLKLFINNVINWSSYRKCVRNLILHPRKWIKYHSLIIHNTLMNYWSPHIVNLLWCIKCLPYCFALWLFLRLDSHGENSILKKSWSKNSPWKNAKNSDVVACLRNFSAGRDIYYKVKLITLKILHLKKQFSLNWTHCTHRGTSYTKVL